MSFAYGADSALAYDSLKNLGREKEYQKVEGNAHCMRLLAFAIFAPIGGLLATVNLALPYLASSIVIFFSGLLALTFIEPRRKDLTVQDSKFKIRKRYYHEIGKGLNLMLNEKKILWLVLFFSLVFFATRLGFWTYQPYMQKVGVPLSLFGVVFASFHLFAALCSKYADKIEKTLKENLTLLIMPFLVIVSFVLMSRFLVLWSVSFILLQQVSMATHEPILKNYLNRHIPSDIRATMLSVQHMAGNLVFAVTAPFLGSFVDKFSVENALLIFALVLIIFSIFLWWFRKIWFEQKRVSLEQIKEVR